MAQYQLGHYYFTRYLFSDVEEISTSNSQILSRSTPLAYFKGLVTPEISPCKILESIFRMESSAKAIASFKYGNVMLSTIK